MVKRIEKIEEILAYEDPKNKWVKLYFDKVKIEGEIGYYNRIVEYDGKPAVAILPIKKKLIGLINIYRYPIGQDVWEAPRGFADTGDPIIDALNELYDETGVRIKHEELIELGMLIPNSGLLASNVYLFAAICDNALESPPPTSEANKFRWFMVQSVVNDINIGKINDAFTLCLLMRARLRNYIEL